MGAYKISLLEDTVLVNLMQRSQRLPEARNKKMSKTKSLEKLKAFRLQYKYPDKFPCSPSMGCSKVLK